MMTATTTTTMRQLGRAWGRAGQWKNIYPRAVGRVMTATTITTRQQLGVGVRQGSVVEAAVVSTGGGTMMEEYIPWVTA